MPKRLSFGDLMNLFYNNRVGYDKYIGKLDENDFIEYFIEGIKFYDQFLEDSKASLKKDFDKNEIKNFYEKFKNSLDGRVN